MATPEDRDQKIHVFHEYDGTTYRLTFSEQATGAHLVSLNLPADQMVELVSMVVSMILGKDRRDAA